MAINTTAGLFLHLEQSIVFLLFSGFAAVYSIHPVSYTHLDVYKRQYQAYGKEILEWSIADGKKRKLLDELYKRYSKILKYEAQHISVMVAGPANYNSKKFDHGDDCLLYTSRCV